MPEQLNRRYEELKKISLESLGGTAVANLISDMASRARYILQRTERVRLSSLTGKNYFSFRGTEQSRPINTALYEDNEREFARMLRGFRRGLQRSDVDAVTRVTYSIAYSVFAAHDVNEVGRKASATFFEILIGHIVARALGIAPRNKVLLPESPSDAPTYLPTDYLFDPGPRSRKIHLPIKTSTRERAVQAWVHQLVLERIFSTGRYRGVLVVASETKRNKRTGQVIEICVPGQLRMFQSRVAEMSRVYYLDPPQVYLELANSDPQIEVKLFGHALSELPQLLNAR
jgi:hypothetical protein